MLKLFIYHVRETGEHRGRSDNDSGKPEGLNCMTKHSPCLCIRTYSDLSRIGVELDGRTVSGGYRYGYQGSEKDAELKGNGNSYTTEFRQLDPRLGRWLSVDQVIQPWQSAYCSMDCNPSFLTDLLGTTVNGDYYEPKAKKDK